MAGAEPMVADLRAESDALDTLVADLPEDGPAQLAALCKTLPAQLRELEDLLRENSIWKARNKGIGYLS
ncbi:MAG: hypothetical protein K2Y33_11500, partial [Mycolicibacterium frederiksbergense]|nr:hypothetical protein [Mycolicibacterium frederiksbergense]